MRNFLAVFGILVSTICFLGNAFAADQNQLQKYIKQKFAKKVLITPIQMTQLAWVIGHTRRTNDMDQSVSNDGLHLEVSRALTRLYCLKLLRAGTKDAYDEFVAAQIILPKIPTLTFSSFKKLCKYVQKLNQNDYELLQTATILSAVSLSDLAFDKVQHVLSVNNVQRDNLDFLATTLRLDSSIYPLLQQFTQDQQSTKKLLYILFPPQTNFRHMLYTEGGAGMFKNLRAMIQHQYMDKNEIDLWYAYWIVNIAGFRGHVSQDGSQYLNEAVFQAMHKLKNLVDKMFDAPNYNPLIAYLQYRSELLGFNHLPKNQALVLAHLGAMMRLYTAEEGEKLYAGFNALSKQQRQEFSSTYLQSIDDYSSLTITHVPALFANTTRIYGGDIAKTIQFVVPIYIQARKIANGANAQSKSKVDQRFSFNVLSSSANIQKMLHLGLRLSKERLQVDKSGEFLVN